MLFVFFVVEKFRCSVRARLEISAASLLGLEAVCFVVVAVTYLLLIRFRDDASLTSSIPAQSCGTNFPTSP